MWRSFSCLSPSSADEKSPGKTGVFLPSCKFDGRLRARTRSLPTSLRDAGNRTEHVNLDFSEMASALFLPVLYLSRSDCLPSADVFGSTCFFTVEAFVAETGSEAGNVSSNPF